jgi:hypothetical protein
MCSIQLLTLQFDAIARSCQILAKPGDLTCLLIYLTSKLGGIERPPLASVTPEECGVGGIDLIKRSG